MKKLRLPQLETARKDPVSFARQLSLDAGASGFGHSKFMDWQRAAFKYLDSKDLIEARQHLELSFRAHFKVDRRNVLDLERYVQILEEFTREQRRKRLVFVESRKNVDFPLVKEKLRLTGQVPTIFMNSSSGYSIYFMTKSSIEWQNELRFPFVQYYFSKKVYGVDIKDVEVGIFNLETRGFEEKSYSNYAVNKALSEIRGLGRSIADNL
ncbi:MAG: hypothetical protein ABL984_11350 [Pyrinomonadaceae bacterium]